MPDDRRARRGGRPLRQVVLTPPPGSILTPPPPTCRALLRQGGRGGGPNFEEEEEGERGGRGAGGGGRRGGMAGPAAVPGLRLGGAGSGGGARGGGAGAGAGAGSPAGGAGAAGGGSDCDSDSTGASSSLGSLSDSSDGEDEMLALRDLQLAEDRGPPGRGPAAPSGVPRLGLGGGVPKLGLPALALGGGGGGALAGPQTARGPGAPRPAEGAPPAADTMGELGRAAPALRARGAQAGVGAGVGKPGRRVELLTPALSLGSAEGMGGGGGGGLEAELGTRLGLEAQDLEFFRLEPLPAAEIGSLGAETAVGVRVLGGTFNLEALEATLADNRRLREEEAARAQTLRALEQHVELQNDVVREQNVTMAEVRQDASAAQRALESQLAEARRDLGGMREERDQLKLQLQNSEGVRDRGSAALRELKREFQALTEGDAPGSDAGDATGEPPAPTAPASPGSSGAPDLRMERVLERLSSPAVLKSLEVLLQKLP